MAGIVPGIVIGCALMGVSYIIARKKGFAPPPRKDLARASGFLQGVGLGSHGSRDHPGRHLRRHLHPPEAAVVAVVYALLVGRFIYKELDFANLYAAFKDATLVNGATTFMIGLSMSFASYLAMEQIPLRIGEWFTSMATSPALVLLLINGLLLVVGCFVDNISSMIILTPILLPVVTRMGVDPVHFGLVMTVALATGFVTPPYGANLFVASAVSGVNMERISRNVFPFILAMIGCLLLFTYVPA